MTTDKKGHTALPWEVLNPMNVGMYSIYSKKGKVALSIDKEADAQFIVTACNSYYELRKAIIDLVDSHKHWIVCGKDISGRPQDPDENCVCGLSDAKQTLKNSGVKQ